MKTLIITLSIASIIHSIALVVLFEVFKKIVAQ